MPYNPDIHHRRSIRLRNYDYSQAGAYFVTICVQGRECLFGEIPIPTVGADPRVCPDGSPDIHMTDAARMAQTIWGEIPDYYPGIDIDAFVVMPNHIHGIVVITGAVGAAPCGRPDIPPSRRRVYPPSRQTEPRQARGINQGQARQIQLGQTRGSAPTGPLSLPDVVQRYIIRVRVKLNML